MKIKVSEEQLTKAIERLIGIDIIIDNEEEARRALGLILQKAETTKRPDYKGFKEIKLTQRVEHATTAMEHTTVYVIEFVLEEESQLPIEIALIQELQKIFRPTR
ncbi:MAG: hypothetical protein ACUVXD_11365 [Thermodesulfobacteriota bacterium]